MVHIQVALSARTFTIRNGKFYDKDNGEVTFHGINVV
jgi:hypothetical protein